MTAKPNLCIIVNPVARQGFGLAKLPQVKSILTRLNLNYHYKITETQQEAQIIAENAIKNNEVVVVMGGDGSIRNVLPVIKKMNGTLGIIPTGRGNDLCRMLKIPHNVDKACELFVSGKVMKIDLGEINNELFLSICSIGFDAIANQIANETRILSGRFAYLYAGLKSLMTAKPYHFHITIDGKKHEHFGLSVAVANSSCYGGGMYLAPNALMTDGLFDIVFVGNISRFRLLLNLPRVFRGTHIHEKGFNIIQGSEITIETEERLFFCADGDVIAKPPATIRLLPRAISVFV